MCGAKLSGSKELDRSGAGKEEYAALCAGCEDSERNGTWPLRSPCCKVRLMGSWIKRREVVNGAKRIGSEKMSEQHYRKGYVRYPEEERVALDGENNDEHMLEQVKQTIVESAREVCE